MSQIVDLIIMNFYLGIKQVMQQFTFQMKR